jgi:dinuclear metal center YbgI/SA1388 family protein
MPQGEEKRRRRLNRDQLTAYLDDYLKIREIKDTSNNGLQVEGAPEVAKAAFAVDACMAAFQKAKRAGAQMLLTHHGLFWGHPVMLRGIHRRRAAFLLEHDISLYSVHLPLDVHPVVGNNARLARLLDLEPGGSFGEYNGVILGVVGELKKAMALDRLVKILEDRLASKMTVLRYGPATIKRVGIISGGAASMVDQAAAAGLDLYVTGEPSHSAFHAIAERGLNVAYGGHYATETLGVKALAEHLGDTFNLETEFLDIPTGF